MCILFCYLQDNNVDIGYELILLSNRDEDFQRPAKQAHVWKDTKYALGGQDQTPSREGGTWLCLNSVQSKIGILLNLTSNLFEQKNPNAQSRGFLVPDFVNKPEVHLDSYMEELQKTKMNYTGFNFLGLERQAESINRKWRAKYINNLESNGLPFDIDTSVFGFSNHAYGDQYAFEKTRLGCQLLSKTLIDLTDNYSKPITDENELIKRTLGILSNTTRYEDDRNIGTVYCHYPISNRNQISSIHVCPTPEVPTYATRTSTVILVRRDQTGLFIEKTLSNPLVDPTQWTQNTWQFKLNDVNQSPILLN